MASTRSNSTTTPNPRNPSQTMVLRAADDLIRETQGIPPRIREHLGQLKAGLAKLVEQKIPVKTIADRYVRKFPWKISQTHLRQYLREEFDYPPQSAAKKAAGSTARKTASKQARASKPKRSDTR